MQQNLEQQQYQKRPVQKKKRPSTAKPKSKGKGKKKKQPRMTQEEQLMQIIQQNPELMAQYQSEFDQIPEMAEEESPIKQEPAQSEPAESQVDNEEQGFDQENQQIIGNLPPDQMAIIQQSQKQIQSMYNPLVQSVQAARLQHQGL